MALQDIINELIAASDLEGPSYNDLPDTDRQRLTEAYMAEEVCSEVYEVLERLPDDYLKLAFSQMAGPDENYCDLFDLRCTFRNAATVYYADAIQGRIDDAFRDYCVSNSLYGREDVA